MFEKFPELNKVEILSAQQIAFALAGVNPFHDPSSVPAETEEQHLKIKGIISELHSAAAMGTLPIIAALTQLADESGSVTQYQVNCLQPSDYPNILEIKVSREEVRKYFNQPESMPFKIKGDMFGKLLNAIEQFPNKYPEYSSNPPRLDKQVRVWLVDTFQCTANEKAIFGKIIYEHYELKDA